MILQFRYALSSQFLTNTTTTTNAEQFTCGSISGYAYTITPAYTSSQIKVQFKVCYLCSNSASTRLTFTIRRGTAYNTSDAIVGSDTLLGTVSSTTVTNVYSFIGFDTPNSTSSTNYYLTYTIESSGTPLTPIGVLGSVAGYSNTIILEEYNTQGLSGVNNYSSGTGSMIVAGPAPANQLFKNNNVQILSNNVLASSLGVASTSLNVGTTINVTGPQGVNNGWSIQSTGPYGGTGYNLTAQLVGGPPTSGLTGPIYSLLSGNLGNTLRVDQYYGNDAVASPGGFPYATVNAAVAAATSGTNIWVMPGVYNLTSGITLPTGVSLRGASTQTVTIQMLNVTSSTRLVTMGNSSRIEDITLLLTSVNSAIANLILTGVHFPGTTTTTAKIRGCVVNVTNNTANVTTNNTYGLYSDGSTVNPTVLLSSNAIQRSTVNVSSNSYGFNRALEVTGTAQFVSRDTVFFATGPTGSIANTGDTYGIRCNNTGAYMYIKTSTVSGTTADAGQPIQTGFTGPALILSATDLINSNTSTSGFGVNTAPNQMYFTVTGAGGSFGNGTTHTLLPGSVAPNQLDGITSLPFSQKTIVFSLCAFITGTGYSFTGTMSINLYTTTTPGILSTTPINTRPIVMTASSIGPFRVQNFSQTFNTFGTPGNYLQVQVTLSGGIFSPGNNAALIVNVSTY